MRVTEQNVFGMATSRPIFVHTL